MNFLFDTNQIDRIIITYDKTHKNFHCAIRMIGTAEGYGVYSTGQTPEIALERANESLDHAERWRKLKF